MNAADWTYSVQIGDHNSIPLQRWSFSRRAIGYGLFGDWARARNANQAAAAAAIEQQLVMMTLGAEDRLATMAEVNHRLTNDGADTISPAESHRRYTALVDAIFDAEWKDWQATWPKQPEGEQSAPPKPGTTESLT